MANYINIGLTCAAYNESLPSNTPWGTGVFYIIGPLGTNVTDRPLKNTLTTSTVENSGSSNVVNYSDYQLEYWWDSTLIRSAINRQNWRFITNVTASSDPLGAGSSYSTANHGNSTISGNFGDAYAKTQITYPADSGSSVTQNSSLYIVNPSDATISTTSANVFTRILGGPTSYGSYTGVGTSGASATVYYLQSGATRNYLYYKNSAVTGVNLDSFTPTIDTTTDLGLRFRVFINSSSGKLFVALMSNDGSLADMTSLGANILSDYTVQFNSTIYTLTTTQPSTGAGEAGWNNSVTMLKFIGSSKYLAWNGTQGNAGSNFFLRDYWKSGFTTSNVIQFMQFHFSDLTNASGQNAPVGGTAALDWYRWRVLTLPQTVPQFNTTSNVFGYPGGTVHVTNSPTVTTGSSGNYTPTNLEGWVLVNSASAASGLTSPNIALAYANNFTIGNSGSTFRYVAYANVTVGAAADSVISWSTTGMAAQSLPAHAFSWNCVKCTPTNPGTTSCEVDLASGATTTAAPTTTTTAAPTTTTTAAPTTTTTAAPGVAIGTLGVTGSPLSIGSTTIPATLTGSGLSSGNQLSWSLTGPSGAISVSGGTSYSGSSYSLTVGALSAGSYTLSVSSTFASSSRSIVFGVGSGGGNIG